MSNTKDIKNLITDDFDIDSLDLGFNDSIGNQLDTSFESSPYKNMNQKTYEGKQNVLMDYLRFYNEDLCITINNKYAFMPLEQNMSMSVFDEGLKSLIHGKSRTPREIFDLKIKLMEFLRNKDDRYSLFSRTLLEPEEQNLFFDKNLYELDQKYLGLGISRKKFSVMQPFQIIELLHGKNLKKHHLSEMFDELRCDRISQHYPSAKPDTPKS
ncbi:hypothetical protein [Pseudomonas kulmbachensis]|uniref:hypothetical protein n=1 Tax=Pseudomonas kulmbachensis TaxID=3043408 RepID=UPI003755017A